MTNGKSTRAVAAPVTALTWDNVLAWRMARQHLRQRVTEAERLARHRGGTPTLTVPAA